jgi:hypothetical protein
MSAQHPTEHGDAVTIASNQAGQVSLCSCGVLTLTMACVSVRFELTALRDLSNLLCQVVQRLDGESASAGVEYLVANKPDGTSGLH